MVKANGGEREKRRWTERVVVVADTRSEENRKDEEGYPLSERARGTRVP